MAKRKRTGIFQRGRVWWIQHCHDGKVVRESVKGALLGDGTIATGLLQKEAERLLDLRKGNAERGMPQAPRAGRLTFAQAMTDVVNDYKLRQRRSLRDLEGRIRNHLMPAFGSWRLAAVTTTALRTYVAKRQAEGARPATINRDLAIVGHAFTLAMEAGTLFARPKMPTLSEKGNERRGFFEPEAFAAVCCHLPALLVPLARFLCITGWRGKSEGQKLLWSWVDFAAGEVRLPAGVSKTQEPRTFPMTRELRQLLVEQRAVVDAIQKTHQRIVAHVFCWEDGRPVKNWAGSWENACRKAGCPGRVVHDFRRTAIRRMVRSGIPERVAMQLSGHRTRTVFDRYNIVSGSDLLAAAERLDAVDTISADSDTVPSGPVSGELAK
jgi:integrase